MLNPNALKIATGRMLIVAYEAAAPLTADQIRDKIAERNDKIYDGFTLGNSLSTLVNARWLTVLEAGGKEPLRFEITHEGAWNASIILDNEKYTRKSSSPNVYRPSEAALSALGRA